MEFIILQKQTWFSRWWFQPLLVAIPKKCSETKEIGQYGRKKTDPLYTKPGGNCLLRDSGGRE